MVDILREVRTANGALRGLVRHTPVRRSRFLGKAIRGEVFLKLENLQVTGSFKVRGAINKLRSLRGTDEHVVAASTGNHALAVAYACSIFGLTCSLYLPSYTKQQKLTALQQYEATLHFVEGDAVQAEYEARRVAQEKRHVFVSPYNDPAVIGGQGTVGTELLAQVSGLNAMLIAVGGGGLISGIAAEAKATDAEIRIIGCSPTSSPVMQESVRAGYVVNCPIFPTLSDGTAGGLESGTITLPLCEQLVDDWIMAGESTITHAMVALHDHESLVVEGAAGVPVGALLKHRSRFTGQRVGIVLCGGNVDWGTFQSIVAPS